MKKNEMQWVMIGLAGMYFLGLFMGLVGPSVSKSVKRVWQEFFSPSGSPVFKVVFDDSGTVETLLPIKAPKDLKNINGVLYRSPGAEPDTYGKKYKHPARAFRELVKLIGKYGVPVQVIEYPNPDVIIGIQQVNDLDAVLNFLNSLEVNYWLGTTREYTSISIYQNDFIIHYRVNLRTEPYKETSPFSRWRWQAKYYESPTDVRDMYTSLQRMAVDSKDGRCWVFDYTSVGVH